MNSQISELFLADPMDFVVEISIEESNQAWEQSQCFSTPSSRWNAYLNRLCLKVLPYLRQEYELEVKLEYKEVSLPSYWEFVNGTPFQIGGKKAVLIPCSAPTYTRELEVHQEWVDITSWVADYYFAVEVNLEEGWLWIWGYTTHEQLKSKSHYDRDARTYSIAEGELIREIEILNTVLELCFDEETRATVAPLSIPIQQAKNLLQRLGNSEITTPRLEVPFDIWRALLENAGWRKSLYEFRLGRQQEWNVLQWLSSGISNIAQQSGWERIELIPSAEASGSGKSARGIEDETLFNFGSSVLCRHLIISEQEYIFLITPVDSEERVWRFELRSASQSSLIPAGFKLRLLDEALEQFEGAEDTADSPVEELYIEFEPEEGEGIVWQTEPISENYDVEILRF
jgi:hypothetical protein